MAKVEPSRNDAADATAEEQSSAVKTTHHHGFAELKQQFSDMMHHVSLEPSHKLLTDEKVLKASLNALYFCVFADAFCSEMLSPNYALMIQEDEPRHKDAFPNINPLKSNTAMYTITGVAGLAKAFAAIAIGPLSDRIGRRPCMLMCLFGGAGGCVLKFFCRFSFWSFCAANFANGLFGASGVVAMAYASDVYPHDAGKKEELIGGVMGIMMLSVNLGGISAILLEKQGLFVPLWIGFGLSVAAGLNAQVHFVEPDRGLHEDASGEKGGEDAKKDAADDDDSPKTLNKFLFAVIMVGCIFDNVGTSGVGFAMFPVMWDTFLIDPMTDGAEVISFNNSTNWEDWSYKYGDAPMTFNSYKWLVTFVAMAILPVIAISAPIYKKLGFSGGCCIGNLCTAGHILALMYLGRMKPTDTNFGLFVFVLYAGFPFTAISNMTTGPMLDAIAPADQKGAIQGYNEFAMNIASAVAPVALGYLGDETNTTTLMWTCIVLSIVACLVNSPLMLYPQFKPKEPKHEEAMALCGEDKDLVERALRGEWVPAAELDKINMDRMNKGQPFLRIHYGKYANEKDRLELLQRQAKSDFLYYKQETTKWIAELADRAARVNMLAMFEVSRPKPEEVKESFDEFGQWFADYLKDSGYAVDVATNPMVMKQMIMSAFPRIIDGSEYTVDNMQPAMLKSLKAMNKLIVLQDENPPLIRLLAANAVKKTN